MNQFTVIASVGKSLERYLRSALADDETNAAGSGQATNVVLARTEDLHNAGSGVIVPPCVSIFLYHAEINKAARSTLAEARDARSGQLPLDLHYLLTPWAQSAELEHRLADRTLLALDALPVLAGTMLTAEGGWSPDAQVQVVLEDLSSELIMRVFQSAKAGYKLSIPCEVRLTRGATAPRGGDT